MAKKETKAKSGEKVTKSVIVKDERGRFAPGHCHPGPGRPKGSKTKVPHLRQLLLDELEKRHDRDQTNGEKIVKIMVEAAKDGDFKTQREILDRVLGKPCQEIIQTNDEDIHTTLTGILERLEATPEIKTFTGEVIDV